MATERPAPETLTLDELLRENARLREERARADRDRRQIERARDRLQRRHDRLKDQLAQSRRAGYRQAAPFAKTRRRGAGRLPGAAYGRRAHRARPRRIDESLEAVLPAACPDCGGAVTPSHVATQHQEDVPVTRPIVRAVQVPVGTCRVCGRRVHGRHAVQTSDALGAAATHLGPHVSSLVVWGHTGLGVPLGKVQRMLRTQYGLTATRGALAQICARVAARARLTTRRRVRRCAAVRWSPRAKPVGRSAACCIGSGPR